jgi:hypothetical protein
LIEESVKWFDDLYQEEWLVNYLAELITGVDVIKEMNRYFPQDTWKLDNMLVLKTMHLSKKDCLDRITSRKDIPQLYKKNN